MPTPREVFEENIRPAELLVCIHTLLENDRVHTEGELVTRVREHLKYDAAEALMLISNTVFLGVIREQARVHSSDLKQSRLDNLLRQAVVVSCSGMETYLYALLETNLEAAIRARGTDYLPNDKQLIEFLHGITFNVREVADLITNPQKVPLTIAAKILDLIKRKYVKGASGIHSVGLLLGLDEPWLRIADKLKRGKEELFDIIKDVTDRRNDIVHRADRPERDPNGPIREIDREEVRLAVSTIGSVCRTLDKLVATRLAELTSNRPSALTGSEETI